MGGFRSSLVTSLKGAREEGLVGNEELAGAEEHLIISGKSPEQFIFILFMFCVGLALFLCHAARGSDPTTPSIPLLCLEGGDKRQASLNASTCPDGCLPFVARWKITVPRIASLSEEYFPDLPCVICKKRPIKLTAQLPEPFPFSPTPEEDALFNIHGISADLRTIAAGICHHKSFQSQRIESLRDALTPSTKEIEDVIDSQMVGSFDILISCSLYLPSNTSHYQILLSALVVLATQT
jgi:hypothetical protein